MVNEVNEKVMPKRSGLIEGATTMECSGAPLSQDESGDWLHKLVPCGF
jgi:hypothetical protein